MSMEEQMPDSTPDLMRHYPALLLWAQTQAPAWARAKVDPADLVQQTLAEAVPHGDRLRALADHAVLAYLRRALTNNIIDAARKFARHRDDVSADAAGASSIRLADWLAAPDTSPSERASRNERFERLAAGLTRLPDAQRLAVELRYLQGAKVVEIAALLGKTEGAVTALLHRAVMALRDVMDDEVPHA
jgi:RNA polymerase sigma-70 factor (ECF subfamily)